MQIKTGAETNARDSGKIIALPVPQLDDRDVVASAVRLDMYFDVVGVASEETKMKIALQNATNEIVHWYTKKQEEVRGWEEMKALLRAEAKNEAVRVLMDRKQRPSESMSDYIAAMKDVGRRGGLEEELVKNMIKRGMRGNWSTREGNARFKAEVSDCSIKGLEEISQRMDIEDEWRRYGRTKREEFERKRDEFERKKREENEHEWKRREHRDERGVKEEDLDHQFKSPIWMDDGAAKEAEQDSALLGSSDEGEVSGESIGQEKEKAWAAQRQGRGYARPPKCYNCNEKGHIAVKCKFLQK